MKTLPHSLKLLVMFGLWVANIVGASAAVTVTLTAPADATTFFLPATVPLTASVVSDSGSITKVEFLTNGTKLAETTIAPYAFNWVNPPAGEYVLTATATNDLGASGQSAPVRIIATTERLVWGPYLNNRGTTNIVVRWRTRDATSSRVRYGLDPAHLDYTNDLADAVSNHVVALTGLLPETRYYYSIGRRSAVILQQPTMTFVTAPPIGASRPTRVWFLSDYGYGETNAQAWVRNAFTNYTASTGKPADLWLAGGDNDQHDGRDFYYTNVFGSYPGILCSTPLFPTFGNHDVHQDFTNAVVTLATNAYFQLFSFPTNGECGGLASANPSYYSFDYGNIHFVGLNSITRALRASGSPMLRWLTNDLAATARPWKIVFWHAPPYTKGTHDSDNTSDSDNAMTDMRVNVVPLLESYGVDLVLCGHSHVYERSYQLQGHVSPSAGFSSTNIVNGGNGREDGSGAYHHASGKGIVFAVVGVGSNPLDAARWYPQWPHPAHAVFYQGTDATNAGSCILDINGDRLDFKFLTGAGTIGDYFTILKSEETPALPTAPSNLAAFGGAGSVRLTWSDQATNEVSYSIERASGGGAFTEIAVVGANVTWFVDNNVSPLTAYEYRLRARSQGGYSTYSAVSAAVPDFPALPLVPLVQELFDGCNDNAASLNGQGGNLTSQVGFYPGTVWTCNAGTSIYSWLFDLAVGIPDTIPGLSPGQSGMGGIGPSYTDWNPAAWATRPLDPTAYLDFYQEQVLYLSFRLDNTGDTAVGLGFASGSAATSSFIGVGALRNTATGMDGLPAGNSLYISDGRLNQSYANANAGPYAVRAHTAAGSLNTNVLVTGRLRLHPTGPDQLDVKLYGPGTRIDDNVDAITWDLSYSITNAAVTNMLATSLAVWLNGTGAYGALDAIRVGRAWKQVTGVSRITGAPQIVSGPVADFNQIVAGRPITLRVEAEGGPTLSYQWRWNGAAIAEATNAFFILPTPGFANIGYYDVVVSNASGSVVSAPQELSVNLAQDDGFDLGSSEGGAWGCTMALQTDGKVVIGGNFTANLGGQPRINIARLNPDGSVDPMFNPVVRGTGQWPGVYFLTIEPGGKILVGGSVDIVGTETRNWFGRLNPDGSLDTSFNPSPNSVMGSVVLQADGKMLVSGWFTSIGGQARSYLARLYNDGSVDTSFNASINSGVRSVILQTNGQMVIAGDFTIVGGQSRIHLARLNANGTLDASFNPSTDGTPFMLAAQADGRVLVGGWIYTLNGQRCSFGRLLNNGTLDSTFKCDAQAYAVSEQTDGRILVGGPFSTLAGQPWSRLGRLNPDGTLDSTFNPSPNSEVDGLALQSDGHILVSGWFTTLAGVERHGLGRLNNTDAAVQSLTVAGNSVTWLRSGTCPQISRASFDASVDGTNWTALGAGTRISGGWRWTGLPISSSTTVRAQGYVNGGGGNNSSWFVEAATGPMLFTSQPVGQYAALGQTIGLGARALGSEPATYQWRKNGAAIEGASAAFLTISNASADATGLYDLVVSNSFGAVTSAVASVTMFVPATNQGDLLVQEMFDGVIFNANLNGQGANLTSAIGFASGSAWACNAGTFIGTYDDVNIVVGNPDTLPGLPPWEKSGGHLGTWGQGYSPAIWATRALAFPAQINFSQDRVVYFSFRLENSGDKAMGIGLASGSSSSSAFIGVGGHWDNHTALDGLSAANSLYISDGRLNQDLTGNNDGPYAARAHTDPGTLNGPALIAGRLTLRASGADQIDVKQYNPGSTIDDNLNSIAWSLSYSITNSSVTNMLATHLLVWMNGEQQWGRLDGIRVGNAWKNVTGETRISGPPRLVSDATVNPTNYFILNQPLTLGVEAEGAPAGYQWRKDEVSLAGATNATFLLTRAAPFGPGNYDVVISNAFGSVTSRVVTVFPPAPGEAVNAPYLTWTTGGNAPWFYQTATNHDGVGAAQSGLLTNTGQSSWLQTTVTGAVTVVFWWHVFSEPHHAPLDLLVDGSTALYAWGDTPWEPRGVHLSAGIHSLRWQYQIYDFNPVDWGYNAAWLDEVVVTNDTAQPPSFVYQPSSTTAPDNWPVSVYLNAVVAGARPMSLQWLHSGNVVADDGWYFTGATTERLQISHPYSAQSGDYQLVASNAFGVVTSTVANLSLTPSAPYVAGPYDAVFCLGSSGGLYVSGYGTPPLSFQWEKDGVPLPNQTNDYWAIPSSTLADAGQYRVIATNLYGSATSQVALVSASSSPPVIDYFWADPVRVRAAGATADFSAQVSGPGPLFYRWQKDGEDLSYGVGSTPSLWLYNLDPTNSGFYRLVVSNCNGVAISPTSVLAVNPVHPLGLAINAPQLVITPGYPPWVVDTTNSHDGFAAARTPALNDWNQSQLSVSITGPTNLSFWWHLSAGDDTWLFLNVDGANIAALSGEQPWREQRVELPSGSHQVGWLFVQGSHHAGADAAWVDQFRFDTNSPILTPGLVNPWVEQTATTHDNLAAWRSAAVPLGSTSLLSGTIQGPGQLAFWTQASFSAGDSYSVMADGLVLTNFTYIPQWQQVTFDFAAGAHQVTWVWSKAYGSSQPYDGAFVDEVTFTPVVPPETPMLHITNAAPGFATVWWVPPTPGFGLQETASLSPPHWVKSDSDTNNPATVPATPAAKFYRLKRP